LHLTAARPTLPAATKGTFMKALIIGIVGLLVGIIRAKRRNGGFGDMMTWGIGHAVAFTIATIVVLMTYDFIAFYVL